MLNYCYYPLLSGGFRFGQSQQTTTFAREIIEIVKSREVIYLNRYYEENIKYMIFKEKSQS